MAVHDNQVREHSGYAKTINKGALKMIYDNLQSGQYQYPIKSTARELASNAVDSIREKLMALMILRGEAKVEDYYVPEVDDEDGVYADSGFDPTYYDPKYLDEENNNVSIIYQEGGNTQKDLLRIQDNGVGLGGARLRGYMELGYSTKRRGLNQLGKFGIGAKVGLSTGVDYYTTISVYNGKRYKFNIYSDNIDSIIPKMNTSTGTENEFEIWKRQLRDGSFEDYPVYYEKTEDKNGVEVQVEFKKHYKQDLIAAIQNQLLYFDNINFKVIEQDGRVVDYPVMAKVLFRNDKILISKNNQFSKPHIVINNVAYGYVDFLELELEAKMGNIGIIVSPDEVEVIPSREAVIYRGKTRDTIIKRLAEVKEIASELVQERLKETDFLRWIRTCISTLSSGSGNGEDDELEVIEELANMVDKGELKPVYLPDKTVKYYASSKAFLKGLDVRLITKTTFYRGGKSHEKVKREDVKQTHEFGNRPVFLQKGNSSHRKDMYMLAMYPDGFITIKEYAEDEKEDFTTQLELLVKEDAGDDADAALLSDNSEKYKARIEKLMTLFKSSADIKVYADVVVPESFSVTEEEEEIEKVDADGEKLVEYADNETRRKAMGQIVAATPSFRSTESSRSWGNGSSDPDHASFVWQKVEPFLADIDSLSDAELYYGTSTKDDNDAKSDEDLLFLATAISRQQNIYSQNYLRKESDIQPEDGYYPTDILRQVVHTDGTTAVNLNYNQDIRKATAWYGKPNVRLVRVSKQNIKYFRKTHNHIQQFFFRIDKTTITMSKTLVQWNTARHIHKYKDRLEFLRNYGLFNPAIAKKYTELMAYYHAFYRDITGYSGARGFSLEDINNLESHTDKVLELQLYVRQNPTDSEGIAHLAKTLFETDEGVITDGLSTELPIYDLLNELLEYAEPIRVLLNPLMNSMEHGEVIDADLEKEIRFYVMQKRGDI